MTEDGTKLALPILTFRHQWFDIRIDTGEMLFPAIVLIISTAYYIETRGLPEESMLYADPLLYATAILAMTTLTSHAISIDSTSASQYDKTAKPDKSVVWGVEQGVKDEKHPKREDKEDEYEPSGNGEYFNTRRAIGLVALSTGYIGSLYFVPFVVTTFVFLAATVYLFGERNVVKMITYSVGFSLILWLVFIQWLLVPLP